MYRWIRPLLFQVPPSAAHDLGQAALWPIEHIPAVRAVVRGALASRADLAVRTLGLTFPNPVGLAGGFDKNALRPRALAALGFGFLELGTVTALPQKENPPPNLFRLPADRALINRLGFPNEGAAQVVARIAAFGGAATLGVPLGMSIGKSRAVSVDDLEAVIEDYLISLRCVLSVADFVVVNVSSPNTVGLRALQGADVARALLSRVRDVSQNKPVLLKVAPDLSAESFDELLEVVRSVGLDGVVATNTTLSRTDLTTDVAAVEAIGAGGLSGPPLRARALLMVRRAREVLGKTLTVIGVGGIESSADARAYLDAGANLVQLYTGFIYGGPLTAWRVARGLTV